MNYTSAQLYEKARHSSQRSASMAWVTLDRQAERGKAFLSFDILTGDLLFVDRISYHFVDPKVGDGFVFRTGAISELPAQLPPGTPPDQYYIKRLVGKPGDKLEIRDFTLYRNGAPITGAAAFDHNAKRENNYPGYRAIGRLAPTRTVEVPRDGFFALGDNSASSLDGRFWGFVPNKDVVGRPLLVYFPLTSHWGPSR